MWLMIQVDSWHSPPGILTKGAKIPGGHVTGRLLVVPWLHGSFPGFPHQCQCLSGQESWEPNLWVSYS
jgi:hypothetical protein